MVDVPLGSKDATGTNLLDNSAFTYSETDQTFV